MVEDLKVVWGKRANAQLEKAYKNIKEDSVQNAENVRQDLLTKAKELGKAPERYPPDKYRKNNNGNFRAFEKHRYRVAYQITQKEIRIIRVRHTSKLPLKY